MGVTWIVSVHSSMPQTSCTGPALDLSEVLDAFGDGEDDRAGAIRPKAPSCGPQPSSTRTRPGTSTCQAVGLGLCLHEKLTVTVRGLGQAERAPLLADSLRVGDAKVIS